MTHRTPDANQLEGTKERGEGREGRGSKVAGLPPRWLDTERIGQGKGWAARSPMCPLGHHANDEYGVRGTTSRTEKSRRVFRRPQIEVSHRHHKGSTHGRILSGPSLFIRALDRRLMWLAYHTRWLLINQQMASASSHMWLTPPTQGLLSGGKT